MAIVKLGRYQVEREQVPALCIQCGEPATTYRTRRFSWYPPWVNVLVFVGLLPAAVVAFALTKRMTVAVPFCDTHRNHWRLRLVITLVGLLLFIIPFAFGVALMVALESAGRLNEDLSNHVAAVFFGGGAVLFLAWLIGALILKHTAIRPTEITDTSISLQGVSKEFAEAAWAQGDAGDDRARRPTRRSRSEDVYEVKARRPKPRPPASYEEDDE